MPLTTRQEALLAGLRNGSYDAPLPGNGTINILPIKPELTSDSKDDFKCFKEFLANNGHPNPRPEELYLTLFRQDFLNLLIYADDRQCLILQNCFGLDISLGSNYIGQIQLINKGNFHQIYNRPDDDFFDHTKDTVYRNGSGTLEFFKNLNFSLPIFPSDGGIWISNFRNLYPPQHESFIFGYSLPVKALIKILSDPHYAFANTEILTARWGLTAYNPDDANELGNFTLVIGTHDLLTSTTVEFRFDGVPIVKGGGNDDEPILCPPHSGC